MGLEEWGRGVGAEEWVGGPRRGGRPGDDVRVNLEEAGQDEV